MRRGAVRTAIPGEPAVTAVVLVHGRRRYFRAAREAIRSVLAHTPFPVLVGVGPGTGGLWLRSRRVGRIRLRPPAGEGRAAGFLLKFHALRAALDRTASSHVLLLDADAVLAGPLRVADCVDALGDRALGMVEQTCILGGPMDRTQLRRFAYETMLPFFGPVPDGLTADDLTYYNSGVVLAEREELDRLTTWALASIESSGRRHDLGGHMVGDQDYFQYWVNVLHPDVCTTLPWTWNHCEHWDATFPDPDAKILHFSNFCHGPRRATVRRMRAARRWGPAAVGDLRP